MIQHDTKMRKYIYTLSLLLLVTACGGAGAKSNKKSSEAAATEARVVPTFDADSAYSYVDKQVAFGYRIPNTPEHVATANYLAAELERHGAAVTVQEAVVEAYDGTKLHAFNIIGAFAPEKRNRVLLCAHWDSRPYADHDADHDNHRHPIDGANDGASGVGVLLEIARQLGKLPIRVGVDIILFDAEDYGQPEFYQGAGDSSRSWALGSQYWSRRPHKLGYSARYGILLDMVGAKGAQFARERYSMQFAPWLVERVWNEAATLGYGNYFVDADGGYVLDDHIYVNAAGVPTIDIIQYNPKSESGFYEHWHTVNDTMEGIDKNTLKAVGQTVLSVIYNE